MGLPAYIIYSGSGSIDSISNRVNLFDLIEVIEVQKVEEKPKLDSVQPEQKKGKTHRVVAAWIKELTDSPDDIFECQIVCLDPNGTELMKTELNSFKFEMPFHRVILPDVTIPGFMTTGNHFFESRLRRHGQTEWAAIQRFPFLVRDKKVENTAKE